MEHRKSKPKSSETSDDVWDLNFPTWDGDFPPIPQEESTKLSFIHAKMWMPTMLPHIMEKRNALMNPERFVL